MKVIFAGCRNYTNHQGVEWAIDNCGFEITEIVDGGCRGVDSIACEIGKRKGIDTTTMYANWVSYGKAAGPIRNKRMALYADALVALWDGESTGTRDMIDQARQAGLEIKVLRINH